MSELRQYDSNAVTGSWVTAQFSIDIVDGTVSGDFLDPTRNEDDWMLEVDQFGNATRVWIGDKTGTVQVTLSASSPTNTRLSQARSQDLLSRNVVGELVITDLNGDTVIACQGAFICGKPQKTFGTTRGNVVWTFKCASLVSFIGGHETVG